MGAHVDRWSDTNKGTEAEPDMRSRLCAREIKRLQETGVTEIAGNASDLFDLTLFSLLTSRRLSRTGKSLKVRLRDIKRAYFKALAARQHLHIEVLTGLIPKGTDPSTVIGIVRKSMFGTRDAGPNWSHTAHVAVERRQRETGALMQSLSDDMAMGADLLRAT